MAVYQREAGLFTEWYAPAAGLCGGRCRRLPCRMGPRRSRQSADDHRPVTVLRDYHAENIMLLDGAARWACSTSRTRSPVIPPMIWSRCCRMRGARFRPNWRRRCWHRYRGRGHRWTTPPMRCWVRSATRRSSASSPGCGSATESRATWLTSRASGAYLERDLEHPALAPVAEWFDGERARRRHVPRRGTSSRCMSRFANSLALRPEARNASPIRTAMVLAAGLGKRMRPLTATRPKPLVEVAGKPLLDHVFDRLRSAPASAASVVNVHYLADALEAHVRRQFTRHGDPRSPTSASELHGDRRRRSYPRAAADRGRDASSSSTATISGSMVRSMRSTCWPRAGTPTAMDALLLMVPLARANCHRGKRRFPPRRRWVGSIRRQAGSGRMAPFVFTGVQLVSRRLFD